MPDFAGNVALSARRVAEETVRSQGYRILQGTWLNAEPEDANLSSVEIEGLTCRWCRKLEHVTGLSNGDQVLLVKGPGVPVTIFGVVIGDITLANVDV